TTPWKDQTKILDMLEQRERDAAAADPDHIYGIETSAYISRVRVRRSEPGAPWTHQESVLHALSTHPSEIVRCSVFGHRATHRDTRDLAALNPDVSEYEAELIVNAASSVETLEMYATLSSPEVAT